MAGGDVYLHLIIRRKESYPAGDKFMRIHIIAQYLDKEDAFKLQQLLTDSGIDSIVKRQGLPRFLGGFNNFQVQIEKSDSEKAGPILAKFNEELKRERDELNHFLSTRCPRCGTDNIDPNYRKNFLEKIFYAGVKIWKCNECGCQWYT